MGAVPKTHTKVMVDVASPAAAFEWWRLPADEVGLARMEFIINNLIKIHPIALVHPERGTDSDALRQISELTRGYTDRRNTSYGRWRLASPRWPHRTTRTR
jgi:pyruvate,water dikinase